jgi:hypothetical protein
MKRTGVFGTFANIDTAAHWRMRSEVMRMLAEEANDVTVGQRASRR